jgi:hypothetical protein
MAARPACAVASIRSCWKKTKIFIKFKSQYMYSEITYDHESVLRIRDVYPGSWFLPIPDPGSRIQRQVEFREGWKPILCQTFL